MSTASPQAPTDYLAAIPSTAGPFRAADYWKLPEGEPVELFRGNLIMSPVPNSRHQVVSALLT